MYVYGYCLHMDFPNMIPIPLFYPKLAVMEPNIYQYWYGVKCHHASMDFYTSIFMPVRVYKYFAYGY